LSEVERRNYSQKRGKFRCRRVTKINKKANTGSKLPVWLKTKKEKKYNIKETKSLRETGTKAEAKVNVDILRIL
jgi:hypothetical protein